MTLLNERQRSEEMNEMEPETTVGERVLIVEDDPATRSGLAELVQAWGFQTAEAAEGEEAMRKVTTFRPAIIVSDLVMMKLAEDALKKSDFENAKKLAEKVESTAKELGAR